jgi:hypothetical protein
VTRDLSKDVQAGAAVLNEGRTTRAFRAGPLRSAHGAIGCEGDWDCGLCGRTQHFSTMLRFFTKRCDFCLATNTFEFLEDPKNGN